MKKFFSNVAKWFVRLPKKTQIISAVVSGVVLVGSVTGIVVATAHRTAHRHEYLSTVTEPTCLEQGYTTYECECGDTYVDNYVSAKGHTEVVDAVVTPTCTTNGKTEGKHCSVCNEVLITQNYIPMSHTVGEWITDKEANCTEDGSKRQVCSVCEATLKTETLTKLGHTDGQWITDKEANCTENGSKYQICSVCSTTLKTETLTKLGHDYLEKLPLSACVADSIVYQCQNCDDTHSSQLCAISADINYCYWSYTDSICFVQDVLYFNGITGGHGKYTITITYTDPTRKTHVYTYVNVDNLYTTKYLGGASWNVIYRQGYPPFVTIEIEDTLGFKTTYTTYFPTLNPDNYNAGYNAYPQDITITSSVEETVKHVYTKNIKII